MLVAYTILFLILSILFFFLAFNYKRRNYPENNVEVWKKKFNTEKYLWVFSIIFLILFLCFLMAHIHQNHKTLILFSLGFTFLLIHMVGKWLTVKCDFESRRKNNTLSQYFADNILGNNIIKPNAHYEIMCDPINKVRKTGAGTSTIVNRNLSIAFFSLFILSFYVKLPYFGKTILI